MEEYLYNKDNDLRSLYSDKIVWSRLQPMKRELVDTIIIHCTDTTPSNNIDMDVVTRWHLERGFNGCGYHYLILPDGRIQLGRPLWAIGAHCIMHNRTSVGICYVGGRSLTYGNPCDTRTLNQRISMEYVMSYVIRVYYPHITRICGHRDFANKTCPNFDATKEYEDFVRQITVNFTLNTNLKS